MKNEDKDKEMEEILKEFHIPTEEEKKTFIDDIARKCIADLTEEDRQAFRDDPDPYHYHYVYGMYIRNTYLYGKRIPFDLIFPDADSVSIMILKRIIELIDENEK